MLFVKLKIDNMTAFGKSALLMQHEGHGNMKG